MYHTVAGKQQQLENVASDQVPVDTVDGLVTCCLTDSSKTPASQESLPSRTIRQQPKSNEPIDNIYESAPIVATTPIPKSKYEKNNDITLNNNNSCCKECRTTNNPYQIDNVTFSKPCLRKLVRKSRSRKQKNNTQEACPPTRMRSLSVGNENTYRHRRATGTLNGEMEFNGDVSSGASGKDRNDECLNNLKRNDLIDIIRESMEKSRLCFQSNG